MVPLPADSTIAGNAPTPQARGDLVQIQARAHARSYTFTQLTQLLSISRITYVFLSFFPNRTTRTGWRAW